MIFLIIVFLFLTLMHVFFPYHFQLSKLYIFRFLLYNFHLLIILNFIIVKFVLYILFLSYYMMVSFIILSIFKFHLEVFDYLIKLLFTQLMLHFFDFLHTLKYLLTCQFQFSMIYYRYRFLNLYKSVINYFKLPQAFFSFNQAHIEEKRFQLLIFIVLKQFICATLYQILISKFHILDHNDSVNFSYL